MGWPLTSADDAAPATLSALLARHPFSAGDPLVISESGTLTLGDLRARVGELAGTLRLAGLTPGQAVGNLVRPGPSPVVVMFAVWAAGGVYVPVNPRYTAQEVASIDAEARLSLLVGTQRDLDAHPVRAGLIRYSREAGAAAVIRPARTGLDPYPPDVAVLSRTSGTTGRPKAVPLRHGGTIDAIDASIAQLRGPRRSPAATPAGRRRMNLIPVPLALWGAIWNTLFSLRAGFGVVLLEEFATARFASAVREHEVRSTVLPPAMIAMPADDREVTDLSPLRMVRSITAPLSPSVARKFHEKFGVAVLTSYGQTELGGEIAGTTRPATAASSTATCEPGTSATWTPTASCGLRAGSAT